MLDRETAQKIEALAEGNEGHPMAKFCRKPQQWYREAKRIARKLGLDSKPGYVVDVGCGFGYFAYACREFGSTVLGTDVRDPLIAEANSILGNNLAQYRITLYNMLPHHCGAPDVVTMFGVNLRDAEGEYWTADCYALLTQTVCGRLRHGGRFILRPNVPYTWDVPEWERLISNFAAVEHDGATITVRPK